GLVVRISAPGTPDRVHGWRLRGYGLVPLTAGAVFDAYCTDAESGDLLAPVPDVRYCAAPDLGDSGTGPAHGHRHRAPPPGPPTAGEVFDADCTDAESGDLIAPESDVDYCAAPDLGDSGTGPAHGH